MTAASKNGNGLWRYTTSALFGVLLTLFSSRVSQGFNGITRGEAISLVKSHAPYVEDRKVIMETVRANTKAIAELTRENRKHSATVAELIGELRASRQP